MNFQPTNAGHLINQINMPITNWPLKVKTGFFENRLYFCSNLEDDGVRCYSPTRKDPPSYSLSVKIAGTKYWIDKKSLLKRIQLVDLAKMNTAASIVKFEVDVQNFANDLKTALEDIKKMTNSHYLCKLLPKIVNHLADNKILFKFAVDRDLQLAYKIISLAESLFGVFSHRKVRIYPGGFIDDEDKIQYEEEERIIIKFTDSLIGFISDDNVLTRNLSLRIQECSFKIMQHKEKFNLTDCVCSDFRYFYPDHIYYLGVFSNPTRFFDYIKFKTSTKKFYEMLFNKHQHAILRASSILATLALGMERLDLHTRYRKYDSN